MCPFLQIVDLGCGDGAVGDALHKRGLTNLTGADISDGMMEFAEKRGIYKALKKADLMKKLPFDDNSFDCAVTSAVTTYLGKYFIIFSKKSTPKLIFKKLLPDSSALKFWLPIVKSGGLFCIVHKASVW